MLFLCITNYAIITFYYCDASANRSSVFCHSPNLILNIRLERENPKTTKSLFYGFDFFSFLSAIAFFGVSLHHLSTKANERLHKQGFIITPLQMFDDVVCYFFITAFASQLTFKSSRK